jgi:hypothetical protein
LIFRADLVANFWINHVALAGSLANVQTKFLNAAMEDMRTMEDNSAKSTQKDTSDMTEEEKIASKKSKILHVMSLYKLNRDTRRIHRCLVW